MKFGVVVFPGTWSDVDCFHVIKDCLDQDVEYIWHKDTDLSKFDCIILQIHFHLILHIELQHFRKLNNINI